MRNYEEEIEQLRQNMKDLDLEKQEKETQLQCVLREQENEKAEMKTTQVVDRSGRAILTGDQAITTTVGRFKENSGIVTNIKKWVTFTDVNGVNQVQAPGNLLVQDDQKPACNRS